MHRVLILVIAICSLFVAELTIAEQTSLPVIDGARKGALVVNGHAEPFSAPITIYDLSYPARTALGSSMSMDNDGNFAVSISPPLIEGHEIIAVDKEGRTSQPVVVTIPDPEAGTAQ